jgi:hypothetical protein
MTNTPPFVPGILPTLGAIAANRMPARRYTNDDLNYAKSWTPKAAHGLVASGFSSGGGKWEVVREFKGKSHKEGGIDIEIKDGRIIRSSGIEPEYIAGGGFWKDLGAGAFGVLEGALDTVTLGLTDPLTDWAYKGLQSAGGSTESEKREQDSIRGYGQAAGALTGAIATGGAATGSAIATGSQGLGQGIAKGNESEAWARNLGMGLEVAGGIAGMAVGDTGYAAGAATKAGEVASEAGEVASKAKDFGKVGKFLNKSRKFSPYVQAGVGALNAMTGTSPSMPSISVPKAPPIQTQGMEKSSRFPTSPTKTIPLPKTTSSIPTGAPFAFTGVQPPNLLSSMSPMVADGRRTPAYDTSYLSHLKRYGVNA